MVLKLAAKWRLMKVSKDEDLKMHGMHEKNKEKALKPSVPFLPRKGAAVVSPHWPDHINPITNLVFRHTSLALLFLLLIACFVAQTWVFHPPAFLQQAMI